MKYIFAANRVLATILMLGVTLFSVQAQRNVGRYAVIDEENHEISLVISSDNHDEAIKAYFDLGESQEEVKNALKDLLTKLQTSGNTFVWQGYSIQTTGTGFATVLLTKRLSTSIGRYLITRQIITQAYIDIAAEKGWDIGHYRVVVKTWGDMASVQAQVDELGGECTYSLGTTRASYRSTDWFAASRGDVLTPSQLAILKSKIEEGVIIRNKETTDFLTLLASTTPSQRGAQELRNSKTSGSSTMAQPEETDSEVFMVVETMPEFPGGQSALFNYLSANVKYPTTAQANGIQGRVICLFVVEKDGSITNVEVVRSGGDASLDAEAIRVIKSMPKWTPGKQRGKNVRVKYSVPVNFRLE